MSAIAGIVVGGAVFAGAVGFALYALFYQGKAGVAFHKLGLR